MVSKHEDIMKNIVSDLKSQVEKSVSDNPLFSELEYTNLGISRLHNYFFELYAEKHSNNNKTQLLRDFLNALMRRNPQLVDEAKALIIEVYGEEDE